ncbi:MAG: hypothetical protein WCI73_10140, partial [Phycisphaerae bacterium]
IVTGTNNGGYAVYNNAHLVVDDSWYEAHPLENPTFLNLTSTGTVTLQGNIVAPCTGPVTAGTPGIDINGFQGNVSLLGVDYAHNTSGWPSTWTSLYPTTTVVESNTGANANVLSLGSIGDNGSVGGQWFFNNSTTANVGFLGNDWKSTNGASVSQNANFGNTPDTFMRSMLSQARTEKRVPWPLTATPLGTTDVRVTRVWAINAVSANIVVYSDAAGLPGVTPALTAPAVATPAAASLPTVTGTTTNLSVVGTDPVAGLEGNLTYTWATTGTPPAAVTFSANGTNAAKNCTATFTKAGNYSLRVTITATNGLATTSTVNVTVNQTLTSVAVTPGSPTVISGQTQQLTATGKDQFGTAMAAQPSFTWSLVSGVGSVNASGLYTASYAAGSASVLAATGSLNSTATVTVSNAVPTVATAAAAAPATVTGTSTNLSVLGADDAGAANLTYMWATTGTPPAAVAFSANGTNAAKNTTATFTKAGNYSFTVTITDLGGLATTSSVNVTVSQTPTTITLNSSPTTLNNGQSTTLSINAVNDQFGNPILPVPTVIWSQLNTPVGTLTPAGVYTAPASGTGSATIQAQVGAAMTTVTISTILGVIAGGGGNDTVRLVLHAPASGQLDVYVNNDTSTPTYSATLAAMSQLLVTDLAGNDTFILDFTNGSPLPAGPITLTGSSLGANTLQVIGTSAADSFGLTTSSLTHGTDPVVNFTNIQTLSLGTGTYTALADLNGLNVTVNAGATVTLNATNHMGMVTLNTGGKLQLPASGSLGLSADGLTITGGVLDLANNSLVVHNGVPGTLTTYLQSGYSLGTWTGTSGILSSYAALPAHTSQGFGMLTGTIFKALHPDQPVLGQTLGDTDVVVQYTYLGDATLNGLVDATDFAQLDASFLRNRAHPLWFQGDYNYDGVIDANDFAVINAAFASQATQPLATSVVVAAPAMMATPTVAVVPSATMPGETWQGTSKPAAQRTALVSARIITSTLDGEQPREVEAQRLRRVTIPLAKLPRV